MTEETDKTLYIIRGLPGTGKSSLAELICGINHVEADMFMVDEAGEYKFDRSKLKYAHAKCQEQIRTWMEAGRERICVSNTSIRLWEVHPYILLCRQFGYTPFVIRCESMLGNIHGVPAADLIEMAEAYEPYMMVPEWLP